MGAKIRILLKQFLYFCHKLQHPMKKSLFIVTALCFIFVACKKYEPQGGGTPAPVYPRYEIGDYYHNDTLQGIIFYTTAGGSSGLMVSLDETQALWCQSNYINVETGVTNPYDGWSNTNGLMANYDLSRFPAIQWSHRKNTWHLVYNEHHPITRKQWYVPASNELQHLLQNQEAVNATLESLGYPTLEGKTYWSSTELGTRSAAALYLQNDRIVISEALKTQTYYVKAIRNF